VEIRENGEKGEMMKDDGVTVMMGDRKSNALTWFPTKDFAAIGLPVLKLIS
jgi:uncharacterized membrane protein